MQIFETFFSIGSSIGLGIFLGGVLPTLLLYRKLVK